MTQQCADCNGASATPLRPVRPVLTRIWVCDNCFQRRTRRGLVTILALVLIPALLTVPSAGVWGVAAALAFLACFPLALVAHEAGHALAFRLVGTRVRCVELGLGRELIRFRIVGMQVIVRALPISGKVHFGGGQRRGARWRFLIGIAAGPAASAAVALAGWSIPVPALSAGLVLAGGFGCAGSLWPRRRHPVLDLPTDGYQIGKVLRATAGQINQTVEAYWVLELQELLAEGRLEQAEHRVSGAQAACPESLRITVLRAAIVSELRPVEGVEAYRELAARPGTAPATRAAVLNGLAWAALMTWDTGLLAEAERTSAEAIELAPDSAAVCDTRGLALIRTGRVEEGLKLSRRALTAPLPPRDRAHVQCAVALGCAALGDSSAAREHLDAARDVLPSDDVLVVRVSEALSMPVSVSA